MSFNLHQRAISIVIIIFFINEVLTTSSLETLQSNNTQIVKVKKIRQKENADKGNFNFF